MTKTIFTLFFCLLLLNSCNTLFSSDDKIKAFLPGTYVNLAESEFSKAIDTLLIRKEGLDGNTYSITRKVSFQRIRAGVIQPKEYQREQWVAIYDEKQEVLHEMKRFRTICYVPEKSKLWLANNEYEKIQ